MKKRILAAFVLLLCLIGLARVCIPQTDSDKAQSSRETNVQHRRIKKTKKQVKVKPYTDPADLRPMGTWRQKSETKPHPQIKHQKICLRVSLRGNRVYVLKKGQRVYTMLSTAGKYHQGKSDTPTGTFYIRTERGQAFFNEKLNEGANNWVSWDPKNKNVFLFHSVPTKPDGSYNLREAAKLGKTQGSHGCIRLSVPDSKWLMENVKVGSKVIIKNE